jgi:hypothetical protein
VLLVEGNAVQLLDGSEGLFGGLVFNKGESIKGSHPSQSSRPAPSFVVHFILYAPFGHALVVQGHENCIFGGVSNSVEFSQQELDEFLAAVFGHNGEAIDDDESVQALLQLDFILLLEICR